jgi:hypothetical protein
MICDLFAGILTIEKSETFQAIFFVFGLYPPGHLAEKKKHSIFLAFIPPPGHLAENKHSIFSKGNFCL